jgi:site-specific DNA recombinase
MMRAATYIRMSTDEQPDSPERQRSQILPYCERLGYRIVQEYSDLGERGWRDDRPQFLRLLQDAQAGKFDVIVVDEMSRLSRQDPFDYIVKVAHPLREAGVGVESVAEGRQDWDELVGMILLTVRQDKARQESITLGRRTATGQVRKAKEGKLFSGRAPYGYRYKVEKGVRKADRKEGLSATVSALALMSFPPMAGSEAHEGIKPHRRGVIARTPSVDRMAATCRVGAML